MAAIAGERGTDLLPVIGRVAASAARSSSRLPRRLPLLYFGFGQLCLAAAFAAVALDPRGLAGFHYHPRMVAVVHLVTLGWVTASILGALYLVGPMALRLPLPARRGDAVVFGAYAVGVVGMVAHFWLAEPRGMVWGAALVTAAVLHLGARVLRALPAAPLPRGIKVHLALAFANLFAAATAGLLLGLDKVFHFLPGYVLANVAAHAHLAALGWAVMLTIGIAYRLLPMLLPAAMPGARWLALSAWLLEAGVLGLFAGLVARSRWAAPFATVAAGGIVVFLARVAWMRRHRRPAPRAARRPDFGVLQVILALGWLVVAIVLGLALAWGAGTWRMGAVLAYGAAGLVGFLAQLVVGVRQRLLPLYVWLVAYAGSAFTRMPASPHAMPSRPLQAATFALWAAGVPLLAVGLAADRAGWVAAGGWVLLAAVVIDTAASARVLRHLGVPRTPGSCDRRHMRRPSRRVQSAPVTDPGGDIMIGSNEIVGDVVARDSRAAAVFQRHGIDFCCGGNRTIDAACEAGGVDAAPVVAELAALGVGDRNGPRFGEWDAAFLADYIVANHHAYVRRALPAISEHVDKVASAHGERHPETVAIAREWSAVAAEMQEHMDKEEEVLFPHVRALAEAASAGGPAPAACFASVAAPIRVMELEHERAGEAMRRIRFLSDGYTPPVDACVTYRVAYEELAEFEHDLHQHVHLENNVLFPRALKLARRVD